MCTVATEVQSVLFVSSGNSARSIMAEAVLNKLGGGRYVAYSAGSLPTRKVDPLVLEVLRARGYPTDGLESKSWHAFSIPLHDPLRYVIAVCSWAARATAPAWPGAPLILEWDLPDHGAGLASDSDRRSALTRLCSELERSIARFIREHD